MSYLPSPIRPGRTRPEMFPHLSSAKKRQDTLEREKMARLEQAEGELSSLRDRAGLAIRRLDERRARNHWRESIEQLIQGAT